MGHLVRYYAAIFFQQDDRRENGLMSLQTVGAWTKEQYSGYSDVPPLNLRSLVAQTYSREKT